MDTEGLGKNKKKKKSKFNVQVFEEFKDQSRREYKKSKNALKDKVERSSRNDNWN